jgi:hypothetical protein
MGGNGELVIHIVFASDRSGLNRDVGLLILGTDRPFQCNFAALGDDLHVMGAGGCRALGQFQAA